MVEYSEESEAMQAVAVRTAGTSASLKRILPLRRLPVGNLSEWYPPFLNPHTIVLAKGPGQRAEDARAICW